ncbi:MAG: homoserine kinase [Cyanobacteria bacterium P01_E01_bin.6]
MPTSNSVTIRVPATTANIGPGFDCLGAALNLYNTFEFFIVRDDDDAQITVTGADAEQVPTDENNLAYRAFASLYGAIARPTPPVKIAISMDIPLSRGLGSSATAIVGGLLGANTLAGFPLTDHKLMDLAIAIEGHPDNVVPALLGGCQLTTHTEHDEWIVCDISWQDDIVPVIAIPEFELSTADARRVLPETYSRADTIFNTSHLGLLLRALEIGQTDWLASALDDRIHQPYRKTLIPGFDAVRIAALDAGAYGVVISGAGPTILALTNSAQSSEVEEAMVNAWKQLHVTATASVQAIAQYGAIATLMGAVH